MILHKDEFPITIQAYDISGEKEFFIAEQVVNNQLEVDNFSSKYAGKLIKAKSVSNTSGNAGNVSSHTARRSSALTTFLVILIILIVLIAIGFYTGWIQRTTGVNL